MYKNSILVNKFEAVGDSVPSSIDTDAQIREQNSLEAQKTEKTAKDLVEEIKKDSNLSEQDLQHLNKLSKLYEKEKQSISDETKNNIDAFLTGEVASYSVSNEKDFNTLIKSLKILGFNTEGVSYDPNVHNDTTFAIYGQKDYQIVLGDTKFTKNNLNMQSPSLKKSLSDKGLDLKSMGNTDIIDTLQDFIGQRRLSKNEVYVSTMQKALSKVFPQNDMGNIDGKFGSKTKGTVKRFQELWNTENPNDKISTDGLPGAQTTTRLIKYFEGLEKKRVKNLEEQNNQLRNSSEIYEQVIANIEMQKQELIDSNNKLKSEIVGLKGEINTLTQKVTNLENDRSDLSDHIKTLNAKIKTLTQKITNLESDRKKLSEALSNSNEDNRILTEDNKSLVQEIDGLKQEVQELKDDIFALTPAT